MYYVKALTLRYNGDFRTILTCGFFFRSYWFPIKLFLFNYFLLKGYLGNGG